MTSVEERETTGLCNSRDPGALVAWEILESRVLFAVAPALVHPADAASLPAATIDWGDGTSSQGSLSADGTVNVVKGSHAYEEEGDYSIAVMIQNVDGTSTSATASAVVADAPLQVAVTNTVDNQTAGLSFTSTVAAFKDTDPNSHLGDETAVIDWGDGSTSPGTIDAVQGAPNTYSVSGTHTYAAGDSFPVMTVIKDAGGSTATANSYQINVTATPAGNNSTGIGSIAGLDFGNFTPPPPAQSVATAAGFTLTAAEGQSFADIVVATAPGSSGGGDGGGTGSSVAPSVTGSVTDATGGAGLGARLVFFDLNQNNVLDFGEPTAITDATGHYTFGPASSGHYHVSLVVNAAEQVTSPVNGFYDVMVNAGQTAAGNDFAVKPLVPSGSSVGSGNGNGNGNKERLGVYTQFGGIQRKVVFRLVKGHRKPFAAFG